MTDRIKQQRDAAYDCVDALRTCVAELITLQPRLREPFLSNVNGAVEKGKAALRAYDEVSHG